MDRTSRKQPRLAAAAATADPEIVLPGAGVEVHSMDQSDWAQLNPRIVSEVADDLLLSDVTEYIRVRSVCKPWRGATADPSLLQPRFFPRNWVMNPEDFEDKEEHYFVNVLTGASLRIKLPTPYEYSHHGSAEGLLVLLDTLTDTVCFLNPLTLVFTDLPFLSSLPGPIRFDRNDITAAGIIVDEARQSEPTAVLCVTAGQDSAIFCAKPRSNHWDTIDVSCIEESEGELPAFMGGLAVGGRFYVPTRAGDVLTVELRPQPHLAYVARQDTGHCHRSCLCFRAFCFSSNSYLVPSVDSNDDGMLLVRTTAGSDASFAVYVVDLASRRVRHIADTGDRTVFLPYTTLRTSVFPSLDEGVRVYDEEG